MAEFSYDIVEELGVIGQGRGGWSRELNKISWNGREPKYDLRDWAPDHEKMGKGISLSKEDLLALRDLLNELDFEED